MRSPTDNAPGVKESVSNWPGSRRLGFGLITIFLSLGFSLLFAELILSYQRQQIEQSDQLEQGMVLYDSRLGWRLAPNWFGSHRHSDFDVDYTTNRYGFRGEFPESKGGKRYAVVGDSFTFGIGVNDDQTFVHLLNSNQEKKDVFFNFSTPGVSTDQQYLLIKNRVGLFRPDVILLVVYLANDLFDNELAFPLQAEHAKPYFQLADDDRLLLNNSPVPLQRKQAAAREKNLVTVVLGENASAGASTFSFLGKLELFRRLDLFQEQGQVSDEVFQQRFESPLRLFKALVSATGEVSERYGAELKIALVPGKSYVERPEGVSYQYQDYLRRRIVAEFEGASSIQVIDLAAMLRSSYDPSGIEWYFPNEGHLTPHGHRVVAELLADRL